MACHVTITIGPPDSGKTTWLKQESKRLAVFPHVFVCGDLGQVSFGAPGLLSAAVVESGKDIENLEPEQRVFIGATHPTGNIPSVLQGIKNLVEWGKKVANHILVDTDGLVSGQIGLEYKRVLLDLLSPARVVLFGSSPSVQNLATWCQYREGLATECIAIPEGLRKKSPLERWKHRNRMFHRWFTDAQDLEIPLDDIRLIGANFGHGIPPSASLWKEVQTVLSENALYGELSENEFCVLVGSSPRVSTLHRLQEKIRDIRIRLYTIRDWKNRLMGDITPEGFSVGLGYIQGWDVKTRILRVHGRFHDTPGVYWRIGTASYPEVLNRG